MTKIHRVLIVMFLPMLFSCAYGAFYTNVKVARSYRSATPNEVVSTKADPVLTGTACNQNVLGLVAWGEGGYGSAVEAALKNQDQSNIIYDVKADSDMFTILGVYSKYCTSVSGKMGKVALK